MDVKQTKDDAPVAAYAMNRDDSIRPPPKTLTKRPGDNITGFWFPVNRSPEEVFRSLTSTKSLLTSLDNQNAVIEQLGGADGQVGATYITKRTQLTGGGSGGRNVHQIHRITRFTVTVSEAPSVFEYVSEIDGRQTRNRLEILETGPASCEVWVLLPDLANASNPVNPVNLTGTNNTSDMNPLCLFCFSDCLQFASMMNQSGVMNQPGTVDNGLIQRTANSLELFLSTHTPIQ